MPQVELHLKASNLKDKDFVGKSDPYFTVSFEGNQLFKSAIIDNNLNPEWEVASFEIPDTAVGNFLQIEIRDDDKTGSEHLAKCDIEYPFRKAVIKCEGEQTVEVLNDHGSIKEELGAKVKNGFCGCFGGKKKKAVKKEE